jgi:hypothetical protein
MRGLKVEIGPSNRFAFPFTRTTVNALIPAGVVGVYLLLAAERPVYIGRSDQCLRTRLRFHGHLGNATHVVWNVCRSPVEAFLLESAWFHWLGLRRLNRIHPARPRDTAVRCPYCERRVYRWLAMMTATNKRRSSEHEQLSFVA